MVDDLSKIREESTPEKTDKLAITEKAGFDLEVAECQLKHLKQKIEQQRNYAKGVFTLVCGWLGIVLLILVAQGFSGCCLWGLWDGYVWGFRLDDKVLIALIGSTTANIIGVLVIIMKYLFR